MMLSRPKGVPSEGLTFEWHWECQPRLVPWTTLRVPLREGSSLVSIEETASIIMESVEVKSGRSGWIL
jgi:hypothetical protein